MAIKVSKKTWGRLRERLPKTPDNINSWKKPAKKRKPPAAKEGNELFLRLCSAHALPIPVAEYAFAKDIGRKWRFDWLFEGEVALEIEGGVWNNGAHVRGKHFLSDMEKYNEAAIMGYLVLRCTWDQVKSGSAFALVKRALRGEE